MAGRIILLNGASSAGKTSTAIALQAILEEPWLRLGIDTFISMLPPRLFGAPPDFAFIRQPDGTAQLDPAFEAHFREPAFRAVAAIAELRDVIYDDVGRGEQWLRLALEIFAPFDVLFVGVTCPVEVLDQREKARGDRVIGVARGSAMRVHTHGAYDVSVDTSELSPKECARAIADRLHAGKPTAFDELRRRATTL